MSIYDLLFQQGVIIAYKLLSNALKHHWRRGFPRPCILCKANAGGFSYWHLSDFG